MTRTSDAEIGRVATLSAVTGAPIFVGVGKTTKRQSAIYALAEWANSRERKLIGMSYGYVLPRERHLAWAKRRIDDCQFLMCVDDNIGMIMTPRVARAIWA